MSKVHFTDTPEPTLVEGSDLVANCGAVIRKAVFAMRFDFSLGDISEWNSLRVCHECLDLEFKHQYLYGLISGEDLKG
jgi:hypothetical protein